MWGENGMKCVEMSTAYIPQRGGHFFPVRDRKTETCKSGQGRRVKATGKKMFACAGCDGRGRRPVTYHALVLDRGTDPGQS